MDPEIETPEASSDPKVETRETPSDPEKDTPETPSDPDGETQEAPSGPEQDIREAPSHHDGETQEAPLDPGATQEASSDPEGEALEAPSHPEVDTRNRSRVNGFGRTDRTCASNPPHKQNSSAKYCHRERGVDGYTQACKEQRRNVFCRRSNKSTRKATRRVRRYAASGA